MHVRAQSVTRPAPVAGAALAGRLATAVVVIAIALYAAGFSFLSIHRHAVYETDAFDLGNMEQALWNTVHGHPLDFTNFDGLTNRLGAHVEPIFFLLAPFYALFPRTETILILQSLVIALGALPICWLARDVLKSNIAAVVFPLVYLLFPALEAANLYDFHPLTLSAAFLAFAFWFAHRRQNTGYWISVILAMGCKEDVPLIIIMLGVWMALSQRRWKLGLATILVALIWFYVAVQVVIPHWNPENQSPYLDTRYGHLGSNMREIAGTLLFNPAYWIGYVTQPAKLAYIRDLFTPVAFTPFFAPLAVLVLSPTLLLILLSGSKLQNTLELEHYPSPMVPIAVISAIFGVALLARFAAGRGGKGTFSGWATGISLIILAFTLTYHYFHGSTPLAAAFAIKEQTERHALADRLAAMIPPDASLSATGALNGHLAARRTLYVYPKVADADWVFVDLAPNIAQVVNRDRYEQLQDLRRQGYGVVAAQDGFLILARGEPDAAEPADAFRRPVPAAIPMQTPLPARFGGVTLAGYDVSVEGRATGSLTLYLRADQKQTKDLRFFTVLLDEADQPIAGSEAELVAPIWFPTSEWQPGQLYAVETKRWGRKDAPGKVRIGLIATMAGNPWDPADRIGPKVEGGATLAQSRDGVLEIAVLESDGKTIWDATPQRLKALPAQAKQLDGQLGQGAVLEGVGALPAECRAPCHVNLTLYWRAASLLTSQPAVFLHVTGPDGRPLAQSDGQPGNGLRPADSWLPGEIVADPHHIDASKLAPGTYQIIAGLYDPATGARLSGPSGDAVPLGTLTITP